jgi:PhnB protein
MPVKPIPEGYHSITPYLIAQGVSKLIEFLKEAFDAKEIFRMANPDGTVAHAEVRIGDSVVMMGEAGGEHKAMPCSIHLYVNDMDTTYVRALEAGATSLREPKNEFYGDRSSGVKDQWGNHWWIVTHVEDVSREEMDRRVAAQRR